jgi:hypothetical protein
MAGAVHTLWFGATAEAQVVASAGAGASCAGRGQEAEKEDLPLEHFPLHLSFPTKFEIHSRRMVILTHTVSSANAWQANSQRTTTPQCMKAPSSPFDFLSLNHKVRDQLGRW